MKRTHRRQYLIGMILVLAIVLFLLNVFSMLGKTNKVDQYWMDTASRSYGWSYEVLTDGNVIDAVPEFLDEYTMTLPGQPAEAVRITRVLTETLPFARIELKIFGAGVEIFLDESLLYSDFHKGERNEEGFLLPEQEDMERIKNEMAQNPSERTVCISLPQDYTGRKLAIVTYFVEGSGASSPVYPFFGNYETVCVVG